MNNVSDVLFGKTRQAMLRLFFSRPTESFHLRQVQRLTRAGLGPVQRELAALTRAGILVRERVGIHAMYRVNRESFVFEELRALVRKTVGAAAMIRQALQPVETKIATAWMFGSAARGAEHAESDVDVLVVSNTLTLRELVAALKGVQKQLGREINPMIYRAEEFRVKLRAKHPFLMRVMNEPRVLLLGEGGESAGLGEVRMVEGAPGDA